MPKSWKKKPVDEETRMKILANMKKIAHKNNGKISFLKAKKISSEVIKSIEPMIQEELVTIVKGSSTTSTGSSSSSSRSINSNVIALDCEMVGVGDKGRHSVLGRCSIVDYNCDVIYDSYVRPTAPVTDYRTLWSGIRPHNLVNAKSFTQASKEIKAIVSGKIIIGHDLKHDLKAIGMTHPSHLIRDTSGLSVLQTGGVPSLRKLAKVLLNLDIQMGPHSSVEDAQTCMKVYKLFEKPWEKGEAVIGYDELIDPVVTAPPPSSTRPPLSSSGQLLQISSQNTSQSLSRPTGRITSRKKGCYRKKGSSRKKLKTGHSS